MRGQHARTLDIALSHAHNTAILKGWTNELMKRPIPTDLNGRLLQGLHEVDEDYPTTTKDSSKEEVKEHPQSAQVGDVSPLTLAMHDSTMAWCLTELARRPDLQTELAAEVKKVLANKPKQQQTMTYDDLFIMPLLTKVINETLRMYPAVSYGTQRELEKDEYITVPKEESNDESNDEKKVLIPKGSNVMLHNCSNHRNKVLWGEDANEWKPEREF